MMNIEVKKSNTINNPQNKNLWVILVPFTIYLCLISIIIFTFTGCQKNKQPVSKEAFLLDTFISISIYDLDLSKDQNNDADIILDNCISKIKYYESLFSRTIETSDVSKINNAKGTPVKVSDETFDLIKKGIYYSDISDGLFDITIAGATKLWDFHENNSSNTLPDDELINAAVSHISYKNIIIDETNKTVALKDPLAEIDLGGLAKGYIADRIKEYLVLKNVTSAIINLGGNILTIGSKPDNQPFKIGIKKPFFPGEIITDVSLTDNGVATSGIYERYFKINDKVYHHILNPKTGYPVETDLYSVSVISDSSVESDALGTICILLGKEKASDFVKQFSDARFIFVDSDYSLLSIP